MCASHLGGRAVLGGAAAGAAPAVTAVHRPDDEARTRPRIDDDRHQGGGTGETVTGDPRVHGRVHLATDGRGIRYGEPA